MSTIISDMEIRLRADIARLQSDMDAARRTVGSAMDNIGAKVKSAMSMFAGLAAGMSVFAMGSFIKGTLDVVDSLTDLSTRTAISVEDLAGLSYGAKLSGTELEAAAASISKLAVNMGKDAERFAKLGVTAQEPLEAFKQVADIFKSIQDPQARAAFGAEALGKSWQEAAVLLNEGSSGISDLVARGQELSGITTQNSADAAAFNDALDELGAVAQGVSVKIAVDLLPVLKILTEEALNSSNAADAADSSFKPLTETFKAIVVFGGNVLYVLKTIGGEIGGIAAQIVVAASAAGNLLRLDFKGAARDFKIAFGEGGMGDKMKADAEASRNAIDEWSERVINAGKETKEALMGVEFPDPFGIDGKIAEENAARADAFVKYAEQQAASKKLADVAAAAAKKEQETYRNLLTTLAERIAAGKAELAAGRELTEAEKATIKLDSELASGKMKLSLGHLEHVRTLMVEANAMDKSAASAKKVREAIQALTDERNAAYVSLASEVKADEDAVKNFGLTKEQIEALTLARMEDRLARRGPQDLDLDEAEVNHLTRMIGLQKEKAATAATLGALDAGSDVTKAKELLDILTAVDNAAKDAASGMAASFGAVGTAIGGMTTALSGFSRDQAAIAAQLATSMKDAGGDPTKIAKAQATAAQQGAQAQVKSYGDMAKAAKGFFKENSTGYRVMETAEKAFRAYEMAMAVESMVKKIFFKEAEVAANLTLNATKLTGEATTTAASTGLAATEASAWGITAVVKALASLPFPLNLAAGAATLAAVVAIGAKMFGGMGGGSVSLSEQRQAANGTGTVLGDSSAKSESIAHSLAIMEKNSGLGLAHTISMDSSLRKMVAGIGNLSSLLARSGVTGAGGGAAAGVQTGSTSTLGKGGQLALSGAATYGGALLGGSIAGAMTMGTIGGSLTMMGAVAGPIGMAIGAAIGFAVSKLFKTSTSIKDQGITGNAMSLGNVDAFGFTAQAYADINVKKKALGISYSSKNSTQTAPLSDEMNDQFTMIISSMGQTIRNAANVLGMGGDTFNARLNSFVVDLGKISLKDLKGEEQQKALETAFSKMGDDMARWGVAGLQQYQAVGEGYLETLSRVANNFVQVTDVLAVLDKSFSTTGLGAVALSEHLIEVSGGIDKLTSGTGYFVQNFLSEAERMAPITKSVNEAMGKLGLAGVKTTDAFKAAVLSAADGVATGKAGAAELYASLLALAEPFKTAADYAAELASATGEYAAVAKTASEIASERNGLQAELDKLTLNALQLRAKERLSIDASNRALFDEVAARSDVAAAYATQSDALKSAIERLKTFALGIQTFKDSLQLGTLSTLTPVQKMMEAQRQYEETLAKARSGDTAAQSALTAAASAYLSADQIVKASSDAYTADVTRVQSDLAALAALAGTQMSEAEKQLSVLDQQVGQLVMLNNTAVAMKDAIAALGLALVAGGKANITAGMLDGSHASGLARVPFDGYRAELHQGEVVVDAQAAAAMRRYFGGAPQASGGNTDSLVAEIKALREEVKGLRADQERQTGDVLGATAEAHRGTADAIVSGTERALDRANYNQQTKQRGIPA